MDEAKLQEIEARANAATPGPWEPEHRGVVGNDVFIVEDCVTAGWDAYRANQAFIATARTDVPDLVAEVRRLTAALATVTAEHAAALDAARREGAEGMRERLAAIWDTRAAEHDATADRFRASRETDLAVDYERWAQRDRAEATAIRALPLDAPGGGS
jgi:hypothetical protein